MMSIDRLSASDLKPDTCDLLPARLITMKITQALLLFPAIPGMTGE